MRNFKKRELANPLHWLPARAGNARTSLALRIGV